MAMLPQLTQNFAFPLTSTIGFSDEKLFSIYYFLPATILLTAIIVFAATINSILLLIILSLRLDLRDNLTIFVTDIGKIRKDIKTNRLYVVYKGSDKQRRQENLKTLKTSSQGVGNM